MRKIQTLILIVALWSAVPGQTPFRALFDLVLEDPSGGVVATSDPETDPFMISLPPPR